eukprot:364952-Chlamydomonas_euryale.AAC.16
MPAQNGPLCLLRMAPCACSEWHLVTAPVLQPDRPLLAPSARRAYQGWSPSLQLRDSDSPDYQAFKQQICPSARGRQPTRLAHHNSTTSTPPCKSSIRLQS